MVRDDFPELLMYLEVGVTVRVVGEDQDQDFALMVHGFIHEVNDVQDKQSSTK